MRKQDLAQIFRSQAGRWPTLAGRAGGRPTFLTPPRPRGDNPPAPDPNAPPAVDLTSPAVVEAINAAKQAALAAARTEWDTEKTRIVGNRDTILAEKKKLEEALGGAKPEEVSARLRELEDLKNKAKAGEHGVDPEKYKTDVETEAMKKHEVWKNEQAQLMEKDRTRITELEEENAKLKVAEHRSWCAAKLAQAALPPNYRYIQEGAEDMVLDRVVGVMERHEVEGLPPVARFKVGGTLQTGSGPGGYMNEREFLDMARQGKLPGMPQLQFLFVSEGQGSDTKSPKDAPPPGGGSWWEMSAEAQTEYVEKHGAKEAKKLMDASPRKKAA